MIKKFIRGVDSFVYKFWVVFGTIIFTLALLIKAMYNMADFPYFVLNKGVDIIMLVGILGLYLWIFKQRQKIQKKISFWMLFAFWGIVGLVYIYMVPIKPFSDMKNVTEGAIAFANRDFDAILSFGYLQNISKNLKVALFYGIIGTMLPKSVFSFRVINVVLYLLISYFSALILKNKGFQYTKVTFFYVASFMPLLLYCNHVYFDLPTYCLCLIALYLYTKPNRTIKGLFGMAILLGIACCMRILALLFVIAILIDMLFDVVTKKGCNVRKNILLLLGVLLVSCTIPKVCDWVVDKSFRTEDAENESIWTLFWMGINEEEFGMMHNEIVDGTKNFDDFYKLLISRDAETNIKLFSKKIFWTWSQGTWQAQRYGFAEDAMREEDKFLYSTPFTKHLLNNEQKLPKIVNSFCRAQYLGFFCLMVAGIWKMNDDDRTKYRVFVYLCFGTFLVLILYEMKSRYVMHCFIAMLVLAVQGLKKLDGELKDNRL